MGSDPKRIRGKGKRVRNSQTGASLSPPSLSPWLPLLPLLLARRISQDSTINCKRNCVPKKDKDGGEARERVPARSWEETQREKFLREINSSFAATSAPWRTVRFSYRDSWRAANRAQSFSVRLILYSTIENWVSRRSSCG